MLFLLSLFKHFFILHHFFRCIYTSKVDISTAGLSQMQKTIATRHQQIRTSATLLPLNLHQTMPMPPRHSQALPLPKIFCQNTSARSLRGLYQLSKAQPSMLRSPWDPNPRIDPNSYLPRFHQASFPQMKIPKQSIALRTHRLLYRLSNDQNFLD